MNFADIAPLQRKEIEEALDRFGLNSKERAVYLALLALGRTTLSPLAHASYLKLTTTQAVTARLVERGLLKVTKSGTRSIYEAFDPIILRRLLERQAEEIAGAIPLLQKMRGEGTAPAKIRVFERERMGDVFRLALAAKSKMVYEIVAAKDLQQVLGERFHFTSRRIQAGVRLKSLRVESREIKKYARTTHVRELREARFLPRDMTFRCSMLFWDDSVAFISPKDEGLAWVVQSAALRLAYEQMFELLWSLGRKMETA
jgi:sugar-specific transcriptional regulator TrmB